MSAFQRALEHEMAEYAKALAEQIEHSDTIWGSLYANMTDEEREAIAQQARDRNLVELEETVEVACQAIYRDLDGYWPSDHERHVIAIALLSHECDPW